MSDDLLDFIPIFTWSLLNFTLLGQSIEYQIIFRFLFQSVSDYQVACHYEEVGAKMRKMIFAESQEEREILVKMN